MAFLSGVLGAVKDENEVTTYDKNITDPEKKLQKVLDTLTKNIGSGRAGLAASVDAVKRWLEGYGEKLDEKTKNVIDKINLIFHKTHENTMIIENFKDDGLAAMNNKFGELMRDTMLVVGSLTGKGKSINDVDKALRDKLATPVGKIQSAVDLLEKSAENPQFSEQGKVVDYQIKNQAELMKREIEVKCEEVGITLGNKLNEIDSKIEAIEAMEAGKLKILLESVKSLVEVVKIAEEAAVSLESQYVEHIVGSVKDIHMRVNHLDTKDIAGGLQEVHAEVAKQLDVLQIKLSELQTVHGEIEKQVDSGFTKIKTDSDNKIVHLKRQIKKAIEEYVNTELGKKVKNNLDMMCDLITKRNAIEGEPGDLDKIVDGVNKYAERFVNFSENVKGWIQSILESASGVKGWFGEYLKENKKNSVQFKPDIIDTSNSVIRPGKAGEIAEAVRNALQNKLSIRMNGATVKPGESNVQGNIESIHKSITLFVNDLERKITKQEITHTDGPNTVVSTIVAAIEGVVVQAGSTDKKYGNYFLRRAVKSILEALNSTAIQLAKELETFALGYKLGDNLTAAINRVKNLGGRIERELISDHLLPGQLGTIINEGVGSKAAGVDFKTPINELLKEAVHEGIGLLNTDLKRYITSQLSDMDGNIKRHINRLSKDATGRLGMGSIQTQITELQREIAELQEAAGGLKNHAAITIKKQVTSVKYNVASLRKSIEKIDRDIQAFDKELLQDLQACKLAVNQTRREMKAQITKVKEGLTQVAQTAFNALYSAVKKMFAEGHKANLKALKELVDAQKDAIQTIVDEDKKSGLKGLLLDMYKEKGSHIKKLQLDSVRDSERFERLSETFNAYLTLIFTYITQQVKTTCTAPSSASTKEVTKLLSNVQGAIDILLKNLETSKHFNKVFVDDLQSFIVALNKFMPSHFAGTPNPKLLDVIKKGLKDLYEQLDRAYVSRYSGDKLQRALLERKENVDVKKPVPVAVDTDDDKKLTKYGKKVASIMVTIIETLHNDLDRLRIDCKANPQSTMKIASGNNLGRWFSERGYTLCAEDVMMNGELNKKKGVNNINSLLIGAGKNIYRDTYKNGETTVTDRLMTNIQRYYNVCHMKHNGSPKYPCSVRDMLIWLCGLRFTAVYDKVEAHCSSLHNEKDEKTQQMPNRNDEVMNRILSYGLPQNLTRTCSLAYTLLLEIQGHGCGFDQADYPYACNFMDNSRGFHYPDSVGSLFDMLADICRRLLCSLYFLRARCRYTLADGNGWADCSYGQQVPSASWQCSNHKSGESTSEATCQPNGQPMCRSTCQPTSPLQCHLMDQLPGCLPHRLTSVGCKSECNTCPKTSPGQQCVTPMGFWDLTHAASKGGTGKDIFAALEKLCKDGSSPLTALLRDIYCLYPHPPKSLGDMFTFFCQLFRTWRSADSLKKHKSGYINNDSLLANMTDNTIDAAFPLPTWFHKNFSNANLTNAITKLYHSDDEHRHPLPKNTAGKGTENTVASNTATSITGTKDAANTNTSCHSDLASLTTLSALCKNSPACSPYLQPLYFHAYNTYPQKHSALYLSWITYTAWNFWNLLQELLSEFQKISCKRYGCASCNCLTGKHGERGACKCASLVQCGSVVSTFHKYGFTFGKAKNLMNAKTCDVFCEQLQRVLKSAHFTHLFDIIDKFVFHIRLPFIWLNVALWLLSLLYLLHIMVIRLDLLHIKSHLHTPSSHRIAAQSLLAAARVNKHNRVFYLQP
ncbi:hypothetical protein, conserved [Babesia bigemina]|uniref:C3H1-type domain-containing protein n=1 Tax=Babesia bigemina TaxID=5866 RepID=A0A061BSF1_BABBI|nr:hypothetical protein, conserved [Babesia bigemina]CDR71467.1 hypothetical protein, conserved [Babesia bigemina]|eukprot:XP_012770414.1 hypothetical protein, conserved [Babesia bigemina]